MQYNISKLMSERSFETLLLLVILQVRKIFPQTLKDLFLLIGSNIEPRLTFLDNARIEIEGKIGAIQSMSKVYESEPWGFVDNVPFLNQVLKIRSADDPFKILDRILQIESKLGRTRQSNGYSSRKIDIDILYYGEEVINEKNLEVPHPRLHKRRFTLLPMCELAPALLHPVLKLTQKELLDSCDDQSVVVEFKGKSN